MSKHEMNADGLMKTILSRRMLHRLGAISLSLTCCLTMTSCIVGAKPKEDRQEGKFVDPPVLESVWQAETNVELDHSKTQARIDGDELLVWGQFPDGSDSSTAPNDPGKSEDEIATFTSLDLASGEKRWQSDSDKEVMNAWIAQDTVVLKYDDKVQILERNDGSVRFEVDSVQKDYTAAATSDGLVMIEEKDSRDHIVYYDLESGDKRWSERVEENKFRSVVPVAAHVPTRPANVGAPSTSGKQVRLQFVQETPLVYASVQREDGATLAAYSVEDGDELAEISIGSDGFDSRDGFMTQTPQDNTVMMVDGIRCEQNFVSVDAKAEQQAEFTLYGGPNCDDGRKSIQRNFVDGKLYGLDEDERPSLIDPDTGETVWTAEETGQPLTFVDGTAMYAVEDDREVKGDDGTASYAVEQTREVKAVDVASGENAWTWDYSSIRLGDDFEMPENVTPIGYRYGGRGDHVILGGTLGSFGLDVRSGKRLWASPGAVEEFNDEYVVLVGGLGKQALQLQVSKMAG